MYSSVARGVAATGLVATGIALSDRDRRDAVRGVTNGSIRFVRAFGWGAAVSFDYKYRLRNLERGSEEYEAVRKEVNLRAAQRLLHVCSMHGGVYTKFGQHIASMNHVLPKEFTETLKVLQDRNPSVGLSEVARTVRSELGAEISELFREFDHKAIAAASLAQVHRAVTMTGEEVAVKLQYPGLESQVQKDLLGMRFLAELLGLVFPEYQYTWLFPEFEESIGLELDFVQEGTNAERVARMFRGNPNVFVPGIHWDLSSRRVLTMDFVHGLKISDKEGIEGEGMNPAEVAKTVTRTFGEMIYCHGFLHCDPHPGNLMVRPKYQPLSSFSPSPSPSPSEGATGATEGDAGRTRTEQRSPKPNSVAHQVVLLDHGMYRRLEPDFRLTYSRLWKAFMTRDTALGERCAVDLGVEPGMYDALSLILTWRPTSTTARVGQRITEEERQALVAKYKVILSSDSLNAFLERLPRDLLFVMRTSDLVRSLNKELGGTTRDRLIVLAESAVRGLNIPNFAPPASKDDGNGNGNGNGNEDGSKPSKMSPEEAEEYVGTSPALSEEEAFREFLEREGLRHPAKLSLGSPHAGVNRLVSSERGMTAPRGLSWWDWLDLRVRIWTMDSVLRLARGRRDADQLLGGFVGGERLAVSSGGGRRTGGAGGGEKGGKKSAVAIVCLAPLSFGSVIFPLVSRDGTSAAAPPPKKLHEKNKG
eukprot:g4466.t1